MLSEPLGMAALCYELDRWFKARGNTPTTVWDVGPGWGKWALLLREIVASHRAEEGDMTPSLLNLHLDGFEMCKYFVDHLNKLGLYDYLDSRDFTKEYWRDSEYPPDLILMFDILEHWTREEITNTIGELFKSFPKTQILISVPQQVHMYKEPYYGEDCPKHKNNLRLQDYRAYFPGCEITSVVSEDRVHSDIFWMKAK